MSEDVRMPLAIAIFKVLVLFWVFQVVSVPVVAVLTRRKHGR